MEIFKIRLMHTATQLQKELNNIPTRKVSSTTTQRGCQVQSMESDILGVGPVWLVRYKGHFSHITRQFCWQLPYNGSSLDTAPLSVTVLIWFIQVSVLVISARIVGP